MSRVTRLLTLCLLCAGWLAVPAQAARSARASVDCRKPPAGSVESLVCQDPELLALDRSLASVYAAARGKARHERPPSLKAEQRGWIKGRNDCWKAGDVRACVLDAYRQRIVELQVQYRLLPASASQRFRCRGDRPDAVAVTFFPTRPPALMAERGDETALMQQAPGTGPARYVGRNVQLQLQADGALIRWGDPAPEMHCVTETPAASWPQTLLAGSTWQLRVMPSVDDARSSTSIAEPQRYTLRLGPDGQAGFRLDCNRGTASWQTRPTGKGAGTLGFGPLAMTKAMCPAGSLADALARQLPHVRSYLFRDGRLFMRLEADGGILQWERVE